MYLILLNFSSFLYLLCYHICLSYFCFNFINFWHTYITCNCWKLRIFSFLIMIITFVSLMNYCFLSIHISGSWSSLYLFNTSTFHFDILKAISLNDILIYLRFYILLYSLFNKCLFYILTYFCINKWFFVSCYIKMFFLRWLIEFTWKCIIIWMSFSFFKIWWNWSLFILILLIIVQEFKKV